MPSDFKTYYKFNVILLMEKNSLKIDSLNTQSIVTEAKRRINGERQCFFTNGAGATGHLYTKSNTETVPCTIYRN